MDIFFHYPPELLNLLNETLPKLCKSKNDLLLFFQGAGVGKFTESIVEDAALDRLGALGHEVLSGLAIAPGEPASERADYRQIFLFAPLQTRLVSSELRLPSQMLRQAGVPAAKLTEADI